MATACALSLERLFHKVGPTQRHVLRAARWLLASGQKRVVSAPPGAVISRGPHVKHTKSSSIWQKPSCMTADVWGFVARARSGGPQVGHSVCALSRKALPQSGADTKACVEGSMVAACLWPEQCGICTMWCGNLTWPPRKAHEAVKHLAGAIVYDCRRLGFRCKVTVRRPPRWPQHVRSLLKGSSTKWGRHKGMC